MARALTPKQIETICLGRIVSHMGHHRVANSISAAKDVTEFFAGLTYREIGALKKHYKNLKETQQNDTKGEEI